VLWRRHLPQAQAARKAEGGEEAHEAGRRGRSAPRGVPRRAEPQPDRCEALSARHLYVHLPFCAHRCGYCDFVTALGSSERHAAYSAALLGELTDQRALIADELETVFIGGGTPTFTEPASLERLLAGLPAAGELTVEANPETVTPSLARLLRAGGVNRVSLGVQSFQPASLAVLDRRAGPADARHAVAVLREAGFDNISLDLIYGIPGQSPSQLADDLDQALALEPEHLSAYELEAKPGTRFTHAHGAALAQQAETMERYIEQVVETLTGGGYRWYETANFCRADPARDLRSAHNVGIWLGHDYLGIGVGAVSTIGERRWRNGPSVERYIAALQAGEAPVREPEELGSDVRAVERVMLGLRLDVPLRLAPLAAVIDSQALARLERRGLAVRSDAGVVLSSRGRLIGDAVTAALLV
jgi:oxygen-independent coproporphyrinogen-3 oxidase